jgi:hypothetical protein
MVYHSICATSNSNPVNFSSMTIFLKAGEHKYSGSGRSTPLLTPIFCLLTKNSFSDSKGLFIT